MPIYRIYTTAPMATFLAFPKLLNVSTTKRRSVLWANDRDVEIWDHKHFVARLPGDPLRSGVK